MKIYFATDHAGFALKNELASFVQSLGYDVEDCGAHTYNSEDDYPDFIHIAGQAVSADPEHTRAIILGGSGQGEAIVANRYAGVRAVVYYGGTLDIITLAREHNNANVLSLGARFLEASMDLDGIKDVVRRWLRTDFEGVDRHQRRINKIDL